MLSKPRSEALHKALTYCFLLLKFRPRTEQELARRLARKKFSQQVIRDSLAFLKEKRFLDDRQFCQAWLESRLRSLYGLRRVTGELALKGVSRSLIDSAVKQVRRTYCEEDALRQVAERKLASLAAAEPRVARQRLYGYLVRRGFSPDEVADTINRLLER